MCASVNLPEMNANKKLRNKCLITAALYFTFFASGITFALIPPSLSELQKLVRTDEAGISTMYTARSAGYLVGALFGGVLFNCLNRQVCLVLLIALMSGTLFAYTAASSLTMLNIFAVLNGFSSGGSDTAINVYVLELWGASCGPFMQGLHFCFALGTGSAPLLMAPFLPNHHESDDLQSNDSTINSNATLQTEPLDIVAHKMRVPYGISAGIILAACFVLLITHVLFGRDLTRSDNSNISPTRPLSGSLAEARQWFASKSNRLVVWLIGLCCLMILFYSGMEIIFFEFMPKFVVEASKAGQRIQAREASYIYSVMNYAYTAARGVGVLAAMKLSAHVIIYADCLILVTANIVLLTSSGSKVGLWTGNVLMGVGFASVYASLYAFIEGHLEVTNAIGALFVFSSGLTAVVYPLLVGTFISEYPLYLIWLTLISVLLTCAVFTLIFVVIRRQKDDYCVSTARPASSVDSKIS